MIREKGVGNEAMKRASQLQARDALDPLQVLGDARVHAGVAVEAAQVGLERGDADLRPDAVVTLDDERSAGVRLFEKKKKRKNDFIATEAFQVSKAQD